LRRKRQLLSLFAVLSILTAFLALRGRGKDHGESELQDLLLRISELAKGSDLIPKIDSSGIAFGTGDDGLYSGTRAEILHIILIERDVLPIGRMREILEAGGSRDRFYRVAKDGIHTSLEGFVKLGNDTLVVKSARLVNGSIEAELYSPQDPVDGKLELAGNLRVDPPGTVGLPARVQGFVELTSRYGPGKYIFFLLPWQVDRDLLQGNLGASPLNVSDLREKVSQFLRSVHT
jgi:hypothetical protein